jgi:protein-tyrosine-phosphatase
MEGLGLSREKLGLDVEKFGFSKEKEGQLSGKQVDQLKDIIGVEKSLERIEDLRKQFNKTGPLAGRVQTLKQFADAAPEKFTQMKVQTASTLSNYVKSISGAQVTEQEAMRLQAIIPSVNDAPKVFEQKLKEFQRIVTMNKKAFAEAIRTGQPLKAGSIKGLMEAESKYAPKQDITEQDIDNMSMEQLKAAGLL